ncbi:transcription factor bHLH146-like [Wolffia australiana]
MDSNVPISTVLSAVFPSKYIAYLIPALFEVSASTRSGEVGEEEAVKRMVRFVVDMALAVSAEELEPRFETGFAWSRALKRELEQDPFYVEERLLDSVCGQRNGSSAVRTLSPIFRPLSPDSQKMKDSSGEDDDLHQSVRTLRRILPGGKRMGVSELICQLESYVACLELQVGILRCLTRAC